MGPENQSENGRINVSRDLLRAELGALELRIVDRLTSEIARKADQEEVRSLRHRVQTLEAQGPLGERLIAEFLEMKSAVDELRQHGSRDAQTALAETRVLDGRMDSLTGWRNRLIGGYAAVVAACAALVTLISLHPRLP